jgi:ribosomal protein S18 acetylase RimI-like enzyme
MLERDPVANNLVLTLLDQASRSRVAGTFWLVSDDRGEARAVALRWPVSMHAAISPVPLDLVGALVEAVARAVPDLSGVGGDVISASAFAGAWVEQCHRGAAPVEGQRMHRLARRPAAPTVAGVLRTATTDDVPLVCQWSERFAAETDSHRPERDAMEQRIRNGDVWLWDADGAVAMAAATGAVAGVSRVGLVYTPPELRNHGYAGACVAALSAQLLSTVATTCVLYTQLSNPVSNSVYRRLGYEPVMEVLRYRLLHEPSES